jgi:hypothetical protein
MSEVNLLGLGRPALSVKGPNKGSSQSGKEGLKRKDLRDKEMWYDWSKPTQRFRHLFQVLDRRTYDGQNEWDGYVTYILDIISFDSSSFSIRPSNPHSRQTPLWPHPIVPPLSPPDSLLHLPFQQTV